MLRTFLEGRLFGSVTGTETPCVLALHGWARSHRDFDAVLAPPGGRAVNAIAVDLPGFGASPPPDEAWGAEAYAEALEPLLADMQSRVVVLGHSFGGRVAVHMAAQRPDSVHALVLSGVPLLHPEDRRGRVAPAYKLARRLHRWGVVSDGVMEAARQRYGSADYKAAEGIMRQVLVRAVNETYETQLEALRCPVHLLWGADDTVVPLEVAARAVALCSQGDLVVHPGVGHLTPLLIPSALHSAVVSCLP
jgi:pimeloyl-ACP methyl ester carboxylesterase